MSAPENIFGTGARAARRYLRAMRCCRDAYIHVMNAEQVYTRAEPALIMP